MISICRKHDFYKNGILISNDRTADVTSTGLFKKDAEVDIDHTIATKTIHDDRGANLSGVDVNELANDKSNLAPTNSALNRSMQDKTADEYKAYMDEKKAHVQANIDELKSKSNMTEKDKQKLAKYENRKDELDEQFNDDTYKNLKRKEAQAKKVYEAKINATYYTSSKFVTDTAKAAANVGARMGVRQVVGFIFTEIWFSVEDEFKKIKDDFDLGKLLNAIGIGVKKGFINAKEKYKELWDKLCSGTVAGIISSVTTTICNIFFTTSKNVVRVIRQSYASLVDAAKVLFLNPDQLVLGERIRAFAKILSTGASIVVGTLVSQGLENTPILGIPVVGDIIPEFCGSFVTGIMTCSLLFFFDRSEVINRLVKELNKIRTVDGDIQYYKDQGKKFDEFAAKLMNIDIKKFTECTSAVNVLVSEIDDIKDEKDLNVALLEMHKKLGFDKPWNGNFDNFISDKNNKLVFS